MHKNLVNVGWSLVTNSHDGDWFIKKGINNNWTYDLHII